MTSAAPIRIIIANANPAQSNPAALTEASGGIARALVDAGYSVSPADTGTRGGTALDVVRELVQAVQDNKELLTSLASLAAPIVTYLLARHQEAQKQAETAPPPSLVINVDGTRQTITVAGPISNEELLTQLMALEAGSNKPITPQSQVQIEVRIPGEPPRRRR